MSSNDCNYDRDCSKVPIPGKCLEFCLERILRDATIEEKQLILGLDKNLAQSIFNAYNNKSINSFRDLKSNLTNQEEADLLLKFKGINQFQLDYFNLSKREREPLINVIKKLRLDSDDELPMYSVVE